MVGIFVCEAKQYVSQENPKVQDYQLHTNSSAKKINHNHLDHIQNGLNGLLRKGHFDRKN